MKGLDIACAGLLPLFPRVESTPELTNVEVCSEADPFKLPTHRAKAFYSLFSFYFPLCERSHRMDNYCSFYSGCKSILGGEIVHKPVLAYYFSYP